MIEHCRKLICSWTEMTSEKGVSKGGVPHWREILGRTCRAALNHIKACAGTPLAAANDDGVWCVTGIILLAARPHSCQLYSFYGLLPPTWPHTFYLQEPARGVLTEASHTHSPSTQPPPISPSVLVMCMHSHAHTFLRVTWAVTLEVLGFDRKSIRLTDECSYVWPGRK